MISFFRGLVAVCLIASVTQCHIINNRPPKLRTVVTTDMEQDDLAALIRYMLYTNDLETQGIIYTSSRYHWAGDGRGTEFFLPGREYTTAQTSWRWTGTTTIQDIVIPAYAEVYDNLRVHDSAYPSPEKLRSIVKIGNIDFEGEMSVDTDGSNLIKSLLLDNDPRPLYIQAWGGINTIARALKSIEEQYSTSTHWPQMNATISRKAVILASGFQDLAYADYVAPSWPQIRVEELSAGYSTWGYNCNRGHGNIRGLPNDHVYFTGNWTEANIQVGPYGKLYRSWLDGQMTPGDPLDGFGNATLAATVDKWCPALGQYDFLSEGDDVAYFPLLTTGIQDPTNPNLGGWGGRSKQNSTTPDLWEMVTSEKSSNGTEVAGYTTDRWIPAVQNDFAARMQWTWTPQYRDGNHAPYVQILAGTTIQARAGSTVRLSGFVYDPDGKKVTTSWWQYFEEGTYPGSVPVTSLPNSQAIVAVPSDAKAGQTISIIFQGTDEGEFPLTRYDRVIIEIGQPFGWCPWQWWGH
jgi:hypothetical protein